MRVKYDIGRVGSVGLRFDKPMRSNRWSQDKPRQRGAGLCRRLCDDQPSASLSCQKDNASPFWDEQAADTAFAGANCNIATIFRHVCQLRYGEGRQIIAERDLAVSPNCFVPLSDAPRHRARQHHVMPIMHTSASYDTHCTCEKSTSRLDDLSTRHRYSVPLSSFSFSSFSVFSRFSNSLISLLIFAVSSSIFSW